MTRWVFRCLIVIGLLASYPLAAILPITVGWENGLVENSQVLLLLVGMSVAVVLAIGARESRVRWFWLMIVPLWLILAAREVSWGAALLMPPLAINPETGPVFSSSAQLAYKPLIYPLVGLVLLYIVVVFCLTRQYQTIAAIFKKHGFPWIELALAIIAALLCSAAEGHGFFAFSGLSEPREQILEELFEFWAYAGIFAAQWVVGRGPLAVIRNKYHAL